VTISTLAEQGRLIYIYGTMASNPAILRRLFYTTFTLPKGTSVIVIVHVDLKSRKWPHARDEHASRNNGPNPDQIGAYHLRQSESTLLTIPLVSDGS
jgi:hypothetical protein